MRVVGFTLFTMRSISMQPTIPENATVVVSAWPYVKADPVLGDVVAFRWPRDPSLSLVERVIAGGGSTIEIVDGVTIVNGKPIDEPYVDPRNKESEYSRRGSLYRVSANEFYVMGDNRDHSADRGVVPRSYLIGKVEKVE